MAAALKLLTSIDISVLRASLDAHARYLTGRPGGQRAQLAHVDLSRCSLDGVDLTDADLSGARLHSALLRGARLGRGAQSFTGPICAIQTFATPRWCAPISAAPVCAAPICRARTFRAVTCAKA